MKVFVFVSQTAIVMSVNGLTLHYCQVSTMSHVSDINHVLALTLVGWLVGSGCRSEPLER